MDPWIAVDDETPSIADYALLGNCQGSALVSRAGSDRLGLPAGARLPRVLRPDPRRARWLLVDPATRRGDRRRARTSTTRWCSRPGSGPRTGTVKLTDFMPLHADDRHNDIGLHSPSGIVRIVEGIDGHVDLDVEIAIRPEYGLTTPLTVQSAQGTWRTRGGPMAVGDLHRRATRDRRRGAARATCRSTRATSSGSHSRPATRGARRFPPTHPRTSSRARDRTISGWLSWAEKLVGYDGRAPGAAAPERGRAARAQLRADRRDRRRADHVAARGDRRRPQLGLPLHVGARRELHDRRARRERLRLRGVPVLRLLRATPRPAAWPAVRACRSCTASGASASSPSTSSTPWPGTAAADRCASATARGTRPSSTCTASCSTPHGRSSSSASRSTRSSESSSPTSPTARRCAGRTSTRASGRCAAAPATSSTRSS